MAAADGEGGTTRTTSYAPSSTRQRPLAGVERRADGAAPADVLQRTSAEALAASDTAVERADTYNPDPARFCPVQITGFQALHERRSQQLQAARDVAEKLKESQEVLRKLEDERKVAIDLRMRHYVERQQTLSHRVLRLYAALERQHLLRCNGGVEPPLAESEQKYIQKLNEVAAEMQRPGGGMARLYALALAPPASPSTLARRLALRPLADRGLHRQPGPQALCVTLHPHPRPRPFLPPSPSPTPPPTPPPTPSPIATTRYEHSKQLRSEAHAARTSTTATHLGRHLDNLEYWLAQQQQGIKMPIDVSQRDLKDIKVAIGKRLHTPSSPTATRHGRPQCAGRLRSAEARDLRRHHRPTQPRQAARGLVRDLAAICSGHVRSRRDLVAGRCAPTAIGQRCQLRAPPEVTAGPVSRIVCAFSAGGMVVDVETGEGPETVCTVSSMRHHQVRCVWWWTGRRGVEVSRPITRWAEPKQRLMWHGTTL